MGQTKHIFTVIFKKNIEKTFFADRGGIEQRFCRRSQQGAQSRTHDRDQVLGGQGGWFLGQEFLVLGFV